MNKYGNRKTTVDGRTFDSRKEATRYAELALMQRAGLISDLQTQVPFEIIPAQKRNGRTIERPVKYIADFVYTENGEQVVEDTKGMKTKEYIIKRKLMLYEFGIQIKEI